MLPSSLLRPWEPPGKNTEVGCHALLQGIFPTQGSNKRLRSPASADGFFTTRTTWEALWCGHVFSFLFLIYPGGELAGPVLGVCKFVTTCQSVAQSGCSMFHSSLGVLTPGKNTGVGCHFLLQCMKVKSESEVAQSCPTLSDPMDFSLPRSSVHGIFQARVLE